MTYEELLHTFWRTVDPTDAGGQFCDRGESYLTAMFVADEAERAAAEASKAEAQQSLGREIVTPILRREPSGRRKGTTRITPCDTITTGGAAAATPGSRSSGATRPSPAWRRSIKRVPSTRPYTPRILLAFDFDGTLASDTIDAVLDLYDTDRETWSREFVEPLGQGWDAIIKRGQALIDLGRARGAPLTRGHLRRAAEQVRGFEGVLDMPEHLSRIAREVLPEIEVECVILSSGYAEVIEATHIAARFERVFASAFHFDANGRAVCIKRVIGHSEKTLYLDAMAKTMDIEGANAPAAAGSHVDEHDRYVPFDQMIYAGDGASDLHAFGFMRQQGGLAIAVDKDDEFDHAEAQRDDQRVDNLAHPDYSAGGELLQSLEHAVRACAQRIALRALGQGE